MRELGDIQKRKNRRMGCGIKDLGGGGRWNALGETEDCRTGDVVE